MGGCRLSFRFVYSVQGFVIQVSAAVVVPVVFAHHDVKLILKISVLGHQRNLWSVNIVAHPGSWPSGVHVGLVILVKRCLDGIIELWVISILFRDLTLVALPVASGV